MAGAQASGIRPKEVIPPEDQSRPQATTIAGPTTFSCFKTLGWRPTDFPSLGRAYFRRELGRSTRRGSTSMIGSLTGCFRPASRRGFACTTGICPRPYRTRVAGSGARQPIAFLEYVLVVAGRIGDRIHHWIPLNEPNVMAYGGYGAGVYPPGHMNEEFFFDSVHHQNLAQGLALKALAGRDRFVGPVLSISPVRPATSRPQDIAAAELHDLIYHRAFLDPLLGHGYPESLALRMAPLVRPGDLEVIAHRPDFLGLNYYGPTYRQAWPGAPFSNDGNVTPADLPMTSEDTPIDSQGLFEVLCSIRDRYERPPVVITENGFPGSDVVGADGRIHDDERIRFLRSHLLAVQKALVAGCDLRGYFVWSFLDSWEWTWGYDQRFGLVYVDFDTGARIPKSSFAWYRSVSRSNQVQP